ncbi:hydantoinase/oxoprolinase family protein [Aquincola sp. MAHUQ-54]|uniref:Hydantoinase/oxoprolinase family protein n=1 Tax=Aquincola agrisoli TaxID=3119538 RepID=A0AAW9PYV8_9BURK
MREGLVVGWDIGGAHAKACLMVDGRVLDVAQWACPLWQGLEHLEQVLAAAQARWPEMTGAPHALTMTGEMVDLFAHREEGVQRIAALAARRLGQVRCFAGDGGWIDVHEAGAHWAQIASANWLATARHAAQCVDEGVLVDIGSTTTDLIAFRKGRVLARGRSDAGRLATGELVYHGVVRTPLCALGPRIAWRGEPLNVMNEFFATTADVYRLTGELDLAHDLHPAADGGAKDMQGTRRRMARMIGLDARDGTPADWLSMAHAWRAAQVAELGGQLQRVAALHGLSEAAVAVSAGCGDFLVPDVLAHAGRPHRCLPYGTAVARAEPGLAGWAQVCAPCVAVAALYDKEWR